MLQVLYMRFPVITTHFYDVKSQSQPPLQSVFTDAFLNYANRSVHESTRQAPLQNQTNKRLLDCPRRPGDPEIPEMNGHLNDCCCDRLAVIE